MLITALGLTDLQSSRTVETHLPDSFLIRKKICFIIKKIRSHDQEGFRTDQEEKLCLSQETNSLLEQGGELLLDDEACLLLEQGGDLALNR